MAQVPHTTPICSKGYKGAEIILLSTSTCAKVQGAEMTSEGPAIHENYAKE